MLLRNTMLWLAGNEAVKRTIVRSRVSRPLARRFVAGETADEALKAIRTLNSRGASATLDYLGENVTSESEARAVATTYTALLRSIAEQRLNCNVSLKLTALGLDIGRRLCVGNLRSVLDAARESDNFVRIDMEGSAYTQVTLDIFEELYTGEGYTNTGIVLQSYLRRTAADVERAIDLGARVRLCKGAYKEPREIAFARKDEVDHNYRMLARRLLHAGNYPGLATHDAEIIEWVKRIARDESIGRERYEFQMLYGIRRDLQRRLIADGYNMRVYVPYGEAWYPYLMRRMAERPANMLFVLRALRHG
jgi:proline dehydrogenase